MRRASLPNALLMVALLSAFAVFLIYPIWLTLAGGFQADDGGFTLYHVRAVLVDDPMLRAGLVNAFAIAFFTTALCFVLALPLAVLAAKFDFAGKGILSALILVPLVLPPFVGAIGLRHLLGRSGAINTLLMQLGVIDQGIDFIGRGGFWAIVVIEALHLYPILYLNATAALANLDPALEEAAENLGAGRTRRLRQIVLPLIRPGLFAGATIVFIWSFTELGTPLMFDFQVGHARADPERASRRWRPSHAALCPHGGDAHRRHHRSYVLGKLVFGGRALRHVREGVDPVAAAVRLGRLGSLAAACHDRLPAA